MSEAVRVLRSLRWSFILRTAILVGCFAATFRQLGFYTLPPFDHAWLDARIYFEATSAWLNGASPWDVSVGGVPFAAPPPALLLALPLQPLGEQLGVATWVAFDMLAVVYLLRRFRLPVYWVLFQPIAEGFLAASADLWLAALMFAGVGWLGALTKPYSIPSLLSRSGARQVLVAVGLAICTIPVLPWAAFLDARHSIIDAYSEFTTVISAFGNPALMAAVVVALAVLPRREGLSLVTPGLLAQQSHYLAFSLDVISRSLILTVAATIPLPSAMAIGVIAYAVFVRSESLRRSPRRWTADARNRRSRRKVPVPMDS